MNVGIIAAMTPDGIIGVDGTLPWHYKADLQRFKRQTMGSSIVFGARTYETLPGRLTGRVVVAVSRERHRTWDHNNWPDGVYGSLGAAIHFGKVRTGTVWIGGGGEIYRLALEQGLVEFIDLTIVPPVEVSPTFKVTRFPVDLLVGWSLIEEAPNPDDPRLLQRRYERLA